MLDRDVMLGQKSDFQHIINVSSGFSQHTLLQTSTVLKERGAIRLEPDTKEIKNLPFVRFLSDVVPSCSSAINSDFNATLLGNVSGICHSLICAKLLEERFMITSGQLHPLGIGRYSLEIKPRQLYVMWRA